jgi:hypothetical protein
MSKHLAPASRTVPTKAWAAISEDVPPNIYEVAWYRENLRSDLRHIRVVVIPDIKKKKSRRIRKTG